MFEGVYKFQFTSEFTTVNDNSFNYFIFEGNTLRYYEDECIKNNQGIFYREGTEWERQ